MLRPPRNPILLPPAATRKPVQRRSAQPKHTTGTACRGVLRGRGAGMRKKDVRAARAHVPSADASEPLNPKINGVKTLIVCDVLPTEPHIHRVLPTKLHYWVTYVRPDLGRVSLFVGRHLWVILRGRKACPCACTFCRCVRAAEPQDKDYMLPTECNGGVRNVRTTI